MVVTASDTDREGTTRDKYEELKSSIREMGSVIVAYSGGVDSALLASAAQEAIGEKALSVTGRSPSLAPSELREAVELASTLGLNHRVIDTNEVHRPEYQANAPDRCFFCKDELYMHLTSLATDEGFRFVANGANVNDLGDYRPGLRAAAQYGVRSPLVEAGLTKAEIRALSKERGLPTWDKPAQACLSSRVPYGTPVTVEVLERIAQAEDFLRELGLRQLRVRHHDTIARIEVEAADISLLTRDDIRKQVAERFRAIGYAYVTLDLEGFRSGSLNEVLVDLHVKVPLKKSRA